MPVSASLHPDSTQERPASLTSTASSSGSSRDSRAMEEPGGGEPGPEGGEGAPRSLPHLNSNNSAGSWLNGQGGPSFSPLAFRAPAGDNQHSYLGRVVREIVETERMYVQDLRSIVEDYLLKIIDTPGLLKPEQVSALFGNIENIYELNSQLLKDLDGCNGDPVAVAYCFVDRSEEFDIYTQYCTNYPNSVAALTECMREKHQAKFFRDRQELLQHSLPLGSYLLKPVQRILKYHLLLQEIAKHFGKEEGFEVVEFAIYTMTCVAWYINDMKRKHEQAVRLQEIQSLLINWKGPDLTTYGELVLEGTFRVHRVRNERTFFLFDKALLITKKRGDHFVYKTHIPCSSLMLIESTRESLCFTVTHYKHNKQQYTIQAKSADEKRGWTHHIKRLILENHHTTIPQKVKEAILEMDSYYPTRYQYSPDRLKKAMDEAPLKGCQGRRRSEPTKQLLKQLNQKARPAGLKHSDSAEALLDSREFRQPLFPWGQQSEFERAAQERDEKEEEEEQAFQHKTSPEDLPLSNGSEKRAGAEPQGSEEEEEEEKEEEEKEEEEEEEEESLEIAEQVADFASSLLAALHCWHYRANALLFSRGATDSGHREHEVAKGCKRPSGQSSSSPQKCVNLAPDSSGSEAWLDRDPEEVLGPAPLPLDHSPERPSDLESSPRTPERLLNLPAEVLATDLPAPEVEPALPESQEDLKTLSSEEEEEEEGAAPESGSILPPSVLDQASVIAEKFISSFSRRSSLALEDGWAGGFGTVHLASQSGSLLSLEGGEKGLYPRSPDDSPDCFPAPEVAPGARAAREPRSPLDRTVPPSPGGPGEAERSPCKKKESLLSTQDRLLLDKIKNYYDHAEHHDASFSLRRRESFSYIPKGLVRNSVTKFNSFPRPEPRAPAERKRLAGLRPASETRSDLPTPGWGDPGDPAPIQDSEFRPSSELVKIWDGMDRSSGARRGLAGKGGREPASGQENGFDLQEPLFILEEHELGAIAEEVPGASSRSPQTHPARLARELKELAKELGSGEPELPATLHPRIVQFSPVMDADLGQRVTNKVYQLARQYSLRIKRRKPVGPNRSEGEPDGGGPGPRLPLVLEEVPRPATSQGKKPALSLPRSEGDNQPRHSSSARSRTPPCCSFGPPSSSRWVPSSLGEQRPPARSPLSPTEGETFHWPDVRQLCSKYACGAGAPQARLGPRRGGPVSRSRSVPDGMTEPAQPEHVNRCFSLEAPRGREDEALFVAADVILDDNRRVIVLEKGPRPEPPTTAEEGEQDSCGQCQSPTSHMAVVEHHKAYQELEEPRGRQEGLAPDSLLPSSRVTAGQQGLVRTLRAKFQTLNSNG
ncbi:pleckstrin homology domain-containing family G member 3 isoform X1 [Tachyglossus aculeatus]|uniref:pleckstrin homology domain-containing family G member 3 isoform X1 n=1 Tax=Tachyglossus aculeatus TaxID=9261 RepID=UPI0018F68805|nr:pleckstrin homology domain-containing family G member 3 isoform X1 [Tachyglossus aculeatus]XP_038621627.1 pleckstrin homology domain-containing family G member 3 isoform X1 [Tachyglossus aculeatus]